MHWCDLVRIGTVEFPIAIGPGRGGPDGSWAPASKRPILASISAFIRKGFIVYLVVVPIFLLFIAVLAYGWFYWQRAKARDAGAATDSASAAPAAPASDQ